MARDFIDVNTGEIIKNVVKITTSKQQERDKNYGKLKKKKRELYEVLSHHSGNFYFYRYDKLLKQLNDRTDIGFRFLYLCTFGDKDGNIIAYDDVKCKTQSDFIHVFEKTKNTACKYIKEFTDNNLLYIENGFYKLNPIYYSLNLSDSDFKKNSIRTFNKAVRELYRNSNHKEHEAMGRLLRLVPYINIYNNTLCWNVEITDIEKMQPLTIEEIRHIIYPSSSNYKYKAFEKLENQFIKGEPVIGRFESINEEQYIINPRLFYRGNDPKDLQAIIDQFDIAKAQHNNKLKKKKMKKEEKNEEKKGWG